MSILAPLWLTLELAALTTCILLLLGTPIAWWLARTSARGKIAVEALTAMPLVLPPTVMGFYLLILLGPNGWIGSWWLSMTGSTLTFSFTGLVIASCVYSLPFVVQPLQSAFESIDGSLIESAHILGARRLDTFVTIVLPLAGRGFLTASVLGFAHTVGEFGVVLMVGGNIPGETQVISIAIYDHVESMEYGAAHQLSLILLVFSFLVLLAVYGFRHHQARSIP